MKDETRRVQSLSELVSLLWGMTEGAAEDLRAFGAPSECYGDCYDAIGQSALRLIHAAGYVDVAHLTRAIEARTSVRWLQFSRLGEVVSLAQSAEPRCWCGEAATGGGAVSHRRWAYLETRPACLNHADPESLRGAA